MNNFRLFSKFRKENKIMDDHHLEDKESNLTTNLK